MKPANPKHPKGSVDDGGVIKSNSFSTLNIIILLILWEFHTIHADHTHLVHELVEVSFYKGSLMWHSPQLPERNGFYCSLRAVCLCLEFMKSLFLKGRMTSDIPSLLCWYFIDEIPNFWRYVTSDLLLGSKATLQDSQNVELSHIFCPPVFSLPIFSTALTSNPAWTYILCVFFTKSYFSSFCHTWDFQWLFIMVLTKPSSLLTQSLKVEDNVCSRMFKATLKSSWNEMTEMKMWL